MTVSSLTGMSQNATGATQKSATSMAQTYDQFLRLLTTQLKNQDPLSPMDSNQMTAQLVQFSQVEQQIAINDKLDKMAAQSKLNATLNAAGFIDKTVQATGDYAILDSKNSEISGKFIVQLEGDAPKSKVTIKNAEGQTVGILSFNGKKGGNELTWDGRNDAGKPQPDGAYTLSVKALDADDKDVKASVATVGKVTDVVVDSKGVAKLSLSGAHIGLDSIQRIKKT